MPKKHYSSVVELVLETLHDQLGQVDTDRFVEALRTHFPRVQWSECYWTWYIEQCTIGRFKHLFSREERKQLSAIKPHPSDHHGAVEIHLSNLAPIRKVAMAALRYEDAMAGTRRLNVTSQIGQMLACYHLKLKLNVDPHQREHCAIDSEGQRIQIKTRRLISPEPAKSDNRLGSLPLAESDYTILVQLDHHYRLVDIWKAETPALLEDVKPGRNSLNFQDFMDKAHMIWPVQSLEQNATEGNTPMQEASTMPDPQTSEDSVEAVPVTLSAPT